MVCHLNKLLETRPQTGVLRVGEFLVCLEMEWDETVEMGGGVVFCVGIEVEGELSVVVCPMT